MIDAWNNVSIIMLVAACVIAIAGFVWDPSLKFRHPDRKDVRMYQSDTFLVQMGEKTVCVDFKYNGSGWHFHVDDVESWVNPHQSEPFTESDREAVKLKLKNVLEAEGNRVTFC